MLSLTAAACVTPGDRRAPGDGALADAVTAGGASAVAPERSGGSRDAAPAGPPPRTLSRVPPPSARPTGRGGEPSRENWIVGTPDADHDDHHAYRLPYGSGVSYPILQGYGSSLSHEGREFFTVDFAMPEGTPVHAARGGLVALVEERHSQSCWAERCGPLANYVVILHADGTTGEYFHLMRGGVLVDPGDRVAAGDLIARSGNTGYTTRPHLHFGVYGLRASGRTESIGVQFMTRGGLVRELRPGARHLNAD